jgi:NAD(P)-dependent dehydrogenase (short-subunit alcohol dehydrogenase family)
VGVQAAAPYETWRGSGDDRRPAVLVTGATGGVGRRVVARLLERGARVRALVRRVAKAHSMLDHLPMAEGGTLEIAVADLAQPRTIRAELFAGVRAVISCAGTTVQPKEEDTDRSKCAPAAAHAPVAAPPALPVVPQCHHICAPLDIVPACLQVLARRQVLRPGDRVRHARGRRV